MLRVIKESKPAWVIGENVAGIINMELNTVLSDLEGEGFEAIPFVIPACGINAWHRRNRVWILAYSASNGRRRRADRQCGTDKREFQQEEQEGREVRDKTEGCTGERVTAESGSERCDNRGDNREERHFQKHKGTSKENKSERKRRECGAGEISSIHGNRTITDTDSNGAGNRKGRREISDNEEWDSKAETRGSNIELGFEQLCGILADSYGGGFKEQQQSSIPQESSKREFWGRSTECGSWWQVEPGVGRVVSRISPELDIIGRLENEKINNQEKVTEVDAVIWQILREMWKYRKLAKTSQGIYGNRLRDIVPEMPYCGTPDGWFMGEWNQKNKELCDMWKDFYSKPFKEAQDLQQNLLIRIRETERKKKMGRVDRLKGLGNAIVPEIAYIFFEMIKEIEKSYKNEYK